MFRLCPYNNTESTTNRETIPCHYIFFGLKIKKSGGFSYLLFYQLQHHPPYFGKKMKLKEGIFGAILMIILGY